MLALIYLCMLVGDAASDDVENITVVERQPVVLPCGTSVQQAPVIWRYQRNPADAGDLISYGGDIVDDYASRFSLSIWSLVIHNVSVEDTGIYVCTENQGIGTRHEVHLVVFKSGITPDSSTVTTQQPMNQVTSSWGAWAISAFAIGVFLVVGIMCGIVILYAKKKKLLTNQHHQSQLALLGCTADASVSDHGELQERQHSGYTAICDARNDKLKGAATSDDSVLIITANYNKIRQFSVHVDYRELQPIDILDLVPSDITFCEESKCFFVAHMPPHEHPGCLYKIKITKNAKITKWVPANKSSASRFHPSSLSIRSGRLLVISEYKELFMFDNRGIEVNNFRLSIPNAEDANIKHAVETENDEFIACVWEPAARPRIVLPNDKGDEMRTFDDTNMSCGLCLPHYLALCRNGQVVVADTGNDRLVLLNAELKYVRVLETKTELHYPWQLCYRETVSKLIVTCRERCVLVFNDFTLDNLREEHDVTSSCL